jgi:hypothetical protein
VGTGSTLATGATTVKATIAFMSPARTVMMASPMAIPVSVPVGDTSRTEGLELDQCRVTPCRISPAGPTACAVS